jgi:hypothetical protein
MQQQQPSILLDYISAVDPSAIIPVIEKGLEIERLQALVDQDPELERRVQQSRALLCVLRTLRLGL